MASIKLKFHPHSSNPHTAPGTLVYQIIHERIIRRIFTPFHLLPSEWNHRLSTVYFTDDTPRNLELDTIRQQITLDLDRFSRIIRRLDRRALPYTADEIVETFRRYTADLSFFSFMEKMVARFREVRKIRTSETYRAALSSFRKFRQGEDIKLDAITPSIMEDYEAWLRNRGNTLNTVSFYMRILRAAYNRAVEQDLIEDRRPFRHVYTGIDKTIKRALSMDFIRKIKRLNLSKIPPLDYARDIFLLSFMLRGMSFVDMAYLKKTDLRNGYVIYNRRKTGQRLVIAWTKEMQRILDKYPENPTEYLFPIIRNPRADPRNVYRNVSYNVNHNLKTIAKRIGIDVPLTMYVARHSWASAAQSKGIPINIISEGMGHDNESTTRIYLAALDTTLIDRANTLILSSL